LIELHHLHPFWTVLWTNFCFSFGYKTKAAAVGTWQSNFYRKALSFIVFCKGADCPRIRHRLDAKNFTKLFRFPVTSNL
jgi:hypothetical protein